MGGFEEVPREQQLLPEVFLTLPDEVTVWVNIELPPNNHQARSFRDDIIGDSSVIPHSELPCLCNMIMTITRMVKIQRYLKDLPRGRY